MGHLASNGSIINDEHTRYPTRMLRSESNEIIEYSTLKKIKVPQGHKVS